MKTYEKIRAMYRAAPPKKTLVFYVPDLDKEIISKEY